MNYLHVTGTLRLRAALVVVCVAAGAPAQEPLPPDLAISYSIDGDHQSQTILKRARDFSDVGEYSQAATLLQRVIDEMPSVLATPDGRTYLPARCLALRALAELPAEGLAAYRLPIDPQAEVLWQRYRRSVDRTALKELVGRFFLSSLGDEAALELAGVYLDREDYAAARRLLRDVLELYPVPTVPRDLLYARLFLAEARSGGTEDAREAWLEFLAAGPAARLVSALTPVQAALSTPPAAPEGDRPMAYGNPRRDGRMSGQELELADAAPWVRDQQWEFPCEPLRYTQPHHRANQRETVLQLSGPRPAMVTGWQGLDLLPTDQILVHRGRLYVAGEPQTACIDPQAGKVLWPTDPQVEDVLGRNPARPAQTKPNGWQLPAIRAFADRLGRSMSISGGRLYRIEQNLTGRVTATVHRIFTGSAHTQQEVPVGNALAAYDAETGERLWRLGLKTTLPTVVIVSRPRHVAQNDLDPPAVTIPYVAEFKVDGQAGDWADVKEQEFAA